MDDVDEFDQLVNKNKLYEKIVEVWINLRLYVQDNYLPWLDAKGAFNNFLILCGYEQKEINE